MEGFQTVENSCASNFGEEWLHQWILRRMLGEEWLHQWIFQQIFGEELLFPCFFLMCLFLSTILQLRVIFSRLVRRVVSSVGIWESHRWDITHSTFESPIVETSHGPIEKSTELASAAIQDLCQRLLTQFSGQRSLRRRQKMKKTKKKMRENRVQKHSM